jgi:integrase
MKQPPEEVTGDIEDIFEYYWEELEITDTAQGSIRHKHSALNKLQVYLIENGFAVEKDESYEYDLSEFGRRDAKKLLKWLKYDAGIDRSTANVYAIQIKKFIQFFDQIGHFAWNPVATELQNFDFEVDQETTKKHIPTNTLRTEIQQTIDPITFVIVFLLAKWGVRRSELTNVDLHDVHLDHPLYDSLFPKPRPEIRDYPDTVYISSEIKEAHEGPHGEVRNWGNKRVRSTKIPIDRETKKVLIWHVAQLMPTELPSEPLLRSQATANNLGDRLGANSISDRVKLWARERGWNEIDMSLDESVHAHWFRHLFTTHLRKNVDPSDINGHSVDYFVKGLRGDTGEDVIDTYTHGWGDYTEKAYKKNIYKLLK